MAVNTKSYIIDASFILTYLFPDEPYTEADALFEEYEKGSVKLCSSSLLPLEVANGLRSSVLRKRYDKKTILTLFRTFLEYPIDFKKLNYEEILSLSLEKSISVYDASYLSLSYNLNLPLLTRDETLKKLSK